MHFGSYLSVGFLRFYSEKIHDQNKKKFFSEAKKKHTSYYWQKPLAARILKYAISCSWINSHTTDSPT